MGYAHVVGSTENGVSYTFDRIKTLVDALENQIYGVAVADENNDRIDGRSPGPPYRRGPPASCARLGDTNLQRTTDGQDEIGESVRFCIGKSGDSGEDDGI
jgi:hypothetical protein